MRAVDADWDLVKRSREGDLRAFEQLVKRYQGPVYSFCRRMTRSNEDAEDVAQETFVRVFRSLDRLKPRAKFSTWLYTVARNLCLNLLRDQARRQTQPLEVATGKKPHSQRGEVADENYRPDTIAARHEISAALCEVLEELSVAHREIIVLREFDGLDYHEIATVLGCRVGTVKSRISRARQHLQELLKKRLEME